MDQQVAESKNTVQVQPNKTPNYLNFNLQIDPGKGRDYPIVAINSSGDKVHATMHLPFDEVELKDYLYDLRFAVLNPSKKPHRILSQREQRVQDFGKRLFDTLITGEVGELYDANQQQIATRTNTHLRLRLSIKPKELASLPWEVLYDSRKGAYVCLTDDISIIRYVEISEPPQSLILNPPLYILGMIANPVDQDPIDREHEKSVIEEALKDLRKKGQVKITWLDEIIRPEKQTWDELQKYLPAGLWNIFHFVGYGRFDDSINDGQIALVKGNGQTDWLDAKKMGQPFAEHKSLRLMVLNASEGARGSELDIFASTASTLVSEGILAALTLQYKISDSEKVEFTRAFYETLVEGQSIDVAMTHGRKATNAEVNSTLDFGTLSLYTCSPDGLLFDMKPEQKRRLFPPMHLGCAMRIAMFTLLIAGIILTAVSYLFDLNKLLGFLTFFMGLFGLIGTFIPIFVRMPDPPTISDTLNTYRQGLNRLKRFFWPSPPYSRRQFLKGLVLGLIPALVLGGELILNISTRKTSPSAPQFIPTPTPETEYPVNTYSGHNGAVNAVAWSPDGQMIASAGADESVQVWKWDSQIADNKPYTGHNGAVNAVTWSPDGKLIASASDDRTVQIWEASSKNPFFTYQGHSQKVTAVAWAPTGKYIASASADGTVQVFDPTTKKRIYTFSGHHGTVNAVAWSPESKYIVSGGNDRTAQVWEATTGNLIAAHMHEDKVNAVAWSSVSNETPIISASNDVIRPVHLWSPTVRTPIPIYLNYRGRGVNSVTWSPTGKWIALTDEGFSVQVWDAINNNFSYSSQEDFGTPPLHYVSWAPKGKHIAAAEESYDVDIWIAKE